MRSRPQFSRTPRGISSQHAAFHSALHGRDAAQGPHTPPQAQGTRRLAQPRVCCSKPSPQGRLVRRHVPASTASGNPPSGMSPLRCRDVHMQSNLHKLMQTNLHPRAPANVPPPTPLPTLTHSIVNRNLTARASTGVRPVGLGTAFPTDRGRVYPETQSTLRRVAVRLGGPTSW